VLAGLTAMLPVALPCSVQADPVTISRGFLESEMLSDFGSARFEGDEFVLDVNIEEGFVPTLRLACTPCVSGTTLDLGGSFSFPRAIGSAVVDGVTYSRIFADGMTGTFTTRSITLSGAAARTVTLPFTFSGVVNGYVEDPFVGSSDAVFTKTLTGGGTATVGFSFSPAADDTPPLFLAGRIRYDFRSTDPVPEPGTLVLCATGAVAAFRRLHGRPA